MARQLARSRRTWDDEDEEETTPRRGRRTSSRDEDDYEEERPRKSRRSSKPAWADDEDDEDEERPRKSSSRRSRRDEDDDEEDEAPRRPRKGKRSSRDEDEGGGRKSASKGSGWGTFKDERAKKAAGQAGRLTVKEKQKALIHFLEEEPFAVYEQHWVGNRSHSCPGGKCPLCAEGYDTRCLALFNVVELENCTNLFWEAGPDAAKAIMEASEEKISSPINRDDLYFKITKTKKSNGFFEYKVTPVKERDLYDDYELEPLSDEELDEAMENLFDDSVIPYTSPRDLRDVAKGDDDD